MTHHVRPAAVTDVQALARMRYAFRAALAPAQEDERDFVRRVEAWMHERLADPRDWFAWVATVDDAIVGNVWLQRVEKMPNPIAESESLGYITNMFVNPERRSSGIGAALLTTAVDFAAETGIHTLILWPSPRSRDFYARHGFEARKNVFSRVLASAPHP